jgi:hypothetical protein
MGEELAPAQQGMSVVALGGGGSVATAQANVFTILGNKIGKNLKIFVEIDEI